MHLPDFLTRDTDGFIHVTGSRVGLHNLIYYYQQGYSAEMLACEYPALPLAVIHKVLAFFLENTASVEEYLAHCQRECEQHRQAAGAGRSLAELRQRLAARPPAGKA